VLIENYLTNPVGSVKLRGCQHIGHCELLWHLQIRVSNILKYVFENLNLTCKIYTKIIRTSSIIGNKWIIIIIIIIIIIPIKNTL
jgi:hypothetical protein